MATDGEWKMSEKIAFVVHNTAFAVGGKIGDGLLREAFEDTAKGSDVTAEYARMCLADGCFSVAYDDFFDQKVQEFFSTSLAEIKEKFGAAK